MSWKAIMFSKTMEDKWRAFAYKVLKIDAEDKQNVA
jgi:transketolase N-terminal domain/subunit